MSAAVLAPALARTLGALLGALAAGFVGLVAGGVLPIAFLTWAAQHSNAPENPGAGWAFLFTIPVGGLIGAMLGAIVGATSPTWGALALRLLLGAALLLVVIGVWSWSFGQQAFPPG